MPASGPGDWFHVWMPSLIGGGLALAALGVALSLVRKRRFLSDLPTSKTHGVFIGMVELKGVAESPHVLRSRLSGAACVWYRWSVEEKWSRTVTEAQTDSRGRTTTRTRTESGWSKVADGGESPPFLLRDDAGTIRIVPDGAQVEPAGVFDRTCGEGDPLYYARGPVGAVTDSDRLRRFREEAIPAGAALYVVGHARLRSDVVAPEIARDRDAPMYLISTRREEKVTAALRRGGWALGLAGLAAAMVGAWVQAGAAFPPGGAPAAGSRWTPPEMLAAVATAYGLAWGLGWLWMAYNSLVGLAQRVRQAWSLVDIELKRRHDLLPNLVEAVKGLRDHERTVQSEVAALAAQIGATPPGEPGPDPRGCVPLIRIIVERYPELKAQASFAALQRTLIDTEQRIALARDYFNNVATFYNTRLEIVPDRFVAALAGMRVRPLIAADAFERAPVQVDAG